MSEPSLKGVPLTPSRGDQPVLALRGVSRSFPQADGRLEVVKSVSLNLQAGELVALIGPSGAGKSTLLQICGLLEPPTAGEVVIKGKDASKLSDDERTSLRRTTIGFVYQYHHLLPEFSAMENIAIPQMIAGIARKEAESRARELLNLVGLAKRADHRPAQLSGGEQQRVAIARALANAPALLLADEPTGNLDHRTSDEVFNLLTKLVKAVGLAAMVATHNMELARRMGRILTITDGELSEAKA
jgi:lipoprotein-releasing system ATP-binding protein